MRTNAASAALGAWKAKHKPNSALSNFCLSEIELLKKILFYETALGQCGTRDEQEKAEDKSTIRDTRSLGLWFQLLRVTELQLLPSHSGDDVQAETVCLHMFPVARHWCRSCTPPSGSV